MKKFWHRIQHIFGWNTGTVEAFWSKDGKLLVGFRCSCGKLQDVEEATGITVNNREMQ